MRNKSFFSYQIIAIFIIVCDAAVVGSRFCCSSLFNSTMFTWRTLWGAKVLVTAVASQ